MEKTHLVLKKFMLSAALCLFLSSTAAPLRADVITYSTPFAVGDFHSGELAGIFSASLSALQFLSLPRFNAPGTLQSVEISFASQYTLTFFELGAFDDHGEADFVFYPPFVVNDRNDTYIDATLQGSLHLQLFDPSSASRTLSLTQLQAGCSAANTSGNTVACEVSKFDTGAYNGTLPIGGLGVAPFVGTDAIDLYVSMNGLLSGVCDHDDQGDYGYATLAGILWTGDLTARYTYAPEGGGGDGGSGGPAPVPEPSTMLLLGSGLIGLAGYGRKKFFKK